MKRERERHAGEGKGKKGQEGGEERRREGRKENSKDLVSSTSLAFGLDNSWL